MAIIEISGGPVTRRYLMRKSKEDLARMYISALEIIDRLQAAAPAQNQVINIPTWQEQDRRGGIDVPGTVRQLMQAEIDALRAAALAGATVALTEDQARAEFQRQHEGRNLMQHHLRGTYVSAPIAALWNQHLRTIKWMQSLQQKAGGS